MSVVAVCGLAGGAGTSTIAYVLARRAVGDAGGPVLLAELDAAAGGLAELTGVTSPLNLGQLAAGRTEPVVANGLPFASLDGGLRVIASVPHRVIPAEDDDLARVVTEAGSLHALTVVDCGTFQSSGCEAVLDVASHIVWVAPRRPRTVERVRAVLLDRNGLPPGAAAELLAIVANARSAGEPPGRALREVAAARCQRLVFVPFDDALASGRPEAMRQDTAGAVLAMATFVAPVRART